jgi:hypothetical protein
MPDIAWEELDTGGGSAQLTCALADGAEQESQRQRSRQEARTALPEQQPWNDINGHDFWEKPV